MNSSNKRARADFPLSSRPFFRHSNQRPER